MTTIEHQEQGLRGLPPADLRRITMPLAWLAARFRAWPLVLVAAVLAWAPALARANPVNAEKLLSDPEEPGWSGSVSTNVALASGNVDRLNVGFSGSIQYWTLYPEGAGYRGHPAPEGARRFFRDRWVLITNGAFVRVALAEVVNNGFAHTRYTRMWLPRLGSEVFAQAQFNEFTRLNLRMLGGLGLRVDPINRRTLQVWAGTGYMIEHERIRVDEGDPHPSEVINHRWTSYMVEQLRIWDSTLLARNTTYVQPRLDDFGDLRMIEAFQVEARTGPLALGLEFELQYDSRPPLFSGVVPLDVFLGSYVRIGGG